MATGPLPHPDRVPPCASRDVKILSILEPDPGISATPSWARALLYCETMSQLNQLKAILVIGSILTVALMWNVERDAVRGRPAHPVQTQTHTQTQTGAQTQSAQAQTAQPARI
jgi:hypothetical protein